MQTHMNQKRPAIYAWRGFKERCCCLFASSLAVAVCGCSSAESDSVRYNPAAPPAGRPLEVKQVDDETLLVVTDRQEQVAIPRRLGETAFEDRLIVVDATKHVEIVRKPAVIMEELSTVPTVYLKAGTDQQVVIEGHQGNPIVDPGGDGLCWLAVACSNPKCPGQALPFAFEFPGYGVDADGRVQKIPAAGASRTPSSTPPCPHCRQRKHLVQYFHPDTLLRQMELRQELQRVREIRSKAGN